MAEVDPFKHPLIATISTGTSESVGRQNWLGGLFTATTSSDGKSKNFPNDTGPAIDNYWCEKASSYITTTGNPFASSESGAMQMKFAQTIGNHYWMTSVIAECKPVPDYNTKQYCPIFTGVQGIRFKWKRYCAGSDTAKSGAGRHRFRCFKVGATFRSGVNSHELLDCWYVGSPHPFFQFKAGTQSGEIALTLRNLQERKQLVGLWFQLETQGNDTGTVSGSYIKIWDLDIDCRHRKLILPKKAVYPKLEPNPGNYFIQTYI
jgi:hypothetical protein